jgi:hypothetical protein
VLSWGTRRQQQHVADKSRRVTRSGRRRKYTCCWNRGPFVCSFPFTDDPHRRFFSHYFTWCSPITPWLSRSEWGGSEIADHFTIHERVYPFQWRQFHLQSHRLEFEKRKNSILLSIAFPCLKSGLLLSYLSLRLTLTRSYCSKTDNAMLKIHVHVASSW